MKKNVGKKIIIVVCLVLAIIGAAAYYLSISSKSNPQEVLQPTEEVKEPVIEYADPSYKKIFDEFQAKAYKKEDYKGQIIFESGIINEPFFQGEDNNTYLRRDYETYEYRVDGPVFLDSNCEIYLDNNIVLYGHNMPKSMDPNQEQLFTPLHQLEDKANYKKNKHIFLVLNDRLEEYDVAYVYRVKVQEADGKQYLVENEPLYFITNFEKNEYQDYLNAVKSRALYSTDVEVTTNDKILTLQTCYETSVDKLIVVAKLVKSTNFE